jgi:hypothetical protein
MLGIGGAATAASAGTVLDVASDPPRADVFAGGADPDPITPDNLRVNLVEMCQLWYGQNGTLCGFPMVDMMLAHTWPALVRAAGLRSDVPVYSDKEFRSLLSAGDDRLMSPIRYVTPRYTMDPYELGGPAEWDGPDPVSVPLATTPLSVYLRGSRDGSNQLVGDPAVRLAYALYNAAKDLAAHLKREDDYYNSLVSRDQADGKPEWLVPYCVGGLSLVGNTVGPVLDFYLFTHVMTARPWWPGEGETVAATSHREHRTRRNFRAALKDAGLALPHYA